MVDEKLFPMQENNIPVLVKTIHALHAYLFIQHEVICEINTAKCLPGEYVL